jgi:porphobilinogen deaminase
VDALSVPAGSALGALAQPTGRWIRLWAAAASEDGSAMARSDLTGALDDPKGLAEAVAHQMIERGLTTVLSGSVS